MEKETLFAVRFKSRREATLFYNDVQKQLKKERSHSGCTDYEHVSHWKERGGFLVTVGFKDPKTLEEAAEFTSCAEWKVLPSCSLSDLHKLEWS